MQTIPVNATTTLQWIVLNVPSIRKVYIQTRMIDEETRVKS